jgi:hypothetical protein
MNKDIFEFWATVPGHETVHPLDRPVLARVKHDFNLNCLPACFDGPLRTAAVVLLYLSPGYNEKIDDADAVNPEAQKRYVERRSGNRHLTDQSENEHHWLWRESRTKAFGTWDEVRSKIAILNIAAYHSKTFADQPLLAALPSSRAVLDYAQSTLFPAAMDGERVVICMRASRFWGLDKARKHGKGLFAPAVTRSGHMLRSDEQAPLRDEIVRLARAAILK